MTEDTEKTEPLYHQDGGIPFGDSYYGSYTSDPARIKKYLDLKKEIEDKLIKDEPVYVQILDHRRAGSVGRLSRINFDYRPASSSTTSSYYGRNHSSLGINNIEVVWDGRKNKCSPHTGELEYLPDWTGGTVWHWTPGPSVEKPPRVIPYDHLGIEIQVGQFVSFVHRRYGNISLRFGTVSRLTDKGGVFVNTLKLRDNDSVGEMKALDAEDLVIVNDDLMKRLVMARLAAN